MKQRAPAKEFPKGIKVFLFDPKKQFFEGEELGVYRTIQDAHVTKERLTGGKRLYYVNVATGKVCRRYEIDDWGRII